MIPTAAFLAAALVLAGAGATSSAPAAEPPRFVDVAEAAGVEVVTWGGGPRKDHLLESTGTGVAFLDYDADGDLDLYFPNAWALDEEPSAVRVRGRDVLYRNRGDGTFEDVTEAAGLGDDSWGCGVCAGDMDGDGRVDLYVTNFGADRLWRNRGDGTFEDVTEAAGVGDDGWGAGCAFFDADGDGDLDLYVANYVDATLDEVLAAERPTRWRATANVMTGPFGMRGGRDRYWINEGGGRFRDATEESGLTDAAESYGLGVLASDLDLDGDVDLYVANDSNPNYLYQNRGDGTFEEIGGWCGAGYSANGAAQAGMGVDAADFDGDGLVDLLVTNFTRDTCTLYRNEGDLFFHDASPEWGLHEATFMDLSWGCAFFDPDLDADLDVLIVNGHIYPQVDEYPELDESYAQLPCLLLREGDTLVRADDRAGPGLAIPVSGRGLAVGDLEGDGDPDLVITAMDRRPLVLRNDGPRGGRWLAVRVLDAAGAPALNARVTVTAGGRTQRGEVRSGSTYQSQSSTDLLFGLGAVERIDRVEVRRLDGTTQVVEGTAPDTRLVVRPGE